MLSLTTGLAPLVLAGLLGWTGAVKAFSKGTARTAPKTALARLLRSSDRATTVLRATGGVELALAGGLLAVPATPAPGAATALLGAGFLGYLGYGRLKAPESSCGCSADENVPVTWRSFARAGLVLAGGVAAALADASWWSVLGDRPAAGPVFLAVSALVLFALSADLDRWWLLPLRRTRLRVFGHPLLGGASGEQVPVAATVELLENSLAWQAAAPVVRSALLDHWEEEGWRILLYSGVYGSGGDARPVQVVFALDATAGRDTPGDPMVRVSYVDADSGQALAAEELQTVPRRSALPMAG
ncbi:MauE/DoxX family redox-associated membrane protein [Streptomyces sp. SCSIO ZS0520]|uniref:MauE/DoxX family redox-associated membrane protein n=1 Tax=Streptomyces sp. SCSIO ZS0520 TaxID=2892996 RepID=UPI0021DB53D0|nr:MauE/DoxX family redox-associated membrane protein [Streptomyces sp. SCSIO ZS0520]